MTRSAALRLYSLHVSPWSERARWILQHHGLAFRKIEHVPLLGEWRLRQVHGHPSARVTVPVLIADGQALTNSWDIALYAERVGRGAQLIPEELEGDVRRWHDLAERAMSEGRRLILARLLASDAALRETLPPPLPRLARRLLLPVARRVTRWFARKYELDLAATAGAADALRESLDALRTALVRSDYVLGRFTYADIIAASLLQAVVPVADRYLPLGPATRQVWTQPELAAAYPDLVAWRDRLYERHRHDSSQGSSSSGASSSDHPARPRAGVDSLA
jgi:glutathione S-transferase